MKTAIIKVEYKDHTKIVLTNRHGDTYTSESESLMDFFHNADEDIEMLQPKWIPVTERLPEVGVPVLVYLPKYGTPNILPMWIEELSGMWFCTAWNFKRIDEATHWTALPEPPNH